MGWAKFRKTLGGWGRGGFFGQSENGIFLWANHRPCPAHTPSQNPPTPPTLPTPDSQACPPQLRIGCTSRFKVTARMFWMLGEVLRLRFCRSFLISWRWLRNLSGTRLESLLFAFFVFFWSVSLKTLKTGRKWCSTLRKTKSSWAPRSFLASLAALLFADFPSTRWRLLAVPDFFFFPYRGDWSRYTTSSCVISYQMGKTKTCDSVLHPGLYPNCLLSYSPLKSPGAALQRSPPALTLLPEVRSI